MSEIRMLLDEIRDLKRRLQALETRGEHPGFAASDVARLSVANTFAGVQTIPNTGLHLLDTNASHDLIIAPGSNLTADRTLTLTTGDADRTLTMTGNATVNQDVSTVAIPTFARLKIADYTGVGQMYSGADSVFGHNVYASAASRVLKQSNTGYYGAWIRMHYNRGIFFGTSTAAGTAEDTVCDPAGTSNEKMMLTNSGSLVIASAASSVAKLQVGDTTHGTTSGTTDVAFVGTAFNLSLYNDAAYNTNGKTGKITFVSKYTSAGVYTIGAEIESYRPNFATDGNYEYALAFRARPNGGNATEYMTIRGSGNVLIGTTTDSGGKMQVDQSSTTAAIPALRLNQADISEGFVDFIGTSAASAAGPISSWTVATIAGYVRCEINGAAYWMAYYNAPTA